MKKISYILSTLLIAASSAFFSSCGENKDFWGPHTLTDDEIAEQERQEEIKRQQRERIDADLILNYTVEFFISGNSYDGGDVKIDMDKIASEFGISKDALGTALNGDGGADVTGFAIEGSTHADNMTSSNSGAYWGHWWDKDGWRRHLPRRSVSRPPRSRSGGEVHRGPEVSGQACGHRHHSHWS